MGKKTCKSLTFDYDTHNIADNMTAMGIEGPYEKYIKAYYDTKKYLKLNGFSHPQYSGYKSNKPITFQEIEDIVRDLTTELPYLKDAINCFQVTTVKRTYEAR